MQEVRKGSHGSELYFKKFGLPKILVGFRRKFGKSYTGVENAAKTDEGRSLRREAKERSYVRGGKRRGSGDENIPKKSLVECITTDILKRICWGGGGDLIGGGS